MQAEHNINSMFLAEHGMTSDQRRGFCNLLIGHLAMLTDTEVWDKAVLHASQSVLKLYPAAPAAAPAETVQR